MSSSNQDDELLLRVQMGDSEAFVDLFASYRGRLKQLLEVRMDHRLRAREDASDVLQEVFIDARKRLSHYLNKPELSFYVWLRQVATQRLIDIHRRHVKAEKRDVRQEVSIDRSQPTATSTSIARLLVDSIASPSQLAMRAEMMVHIERALNEMDDIDREVLILRHFEELKNHEVAEILDLKETAASNRYVRALARLRDALADIPSFFDET